MANENVDEKPKKMGKNGRPLGRPTYASQGKKKKADTQKTWKIDVPNGDVSVNDWLALQDDASVSVRLIIKEFIQRKGMIDAACQPVEYSPVGRKSVEKKEQAEGIESKAESKEPEDTVVETTASTRIVNNDDEDDMGSIFKR